MPEDGVVRLSTPLTMQSPRSARNISKQQHTTLAKNNTNIDALDERLLAGFLGIGCLRQHGQGRPPSHPYDHRPGQGHHRNILINRNFSRTVHGKDTRQQTRRVYPADAG